MACLGHLFGRHQVDKNWSTKRKSAAANDRNM